MKKYYLVLGFDSLTCEIRTPNPALFSTSAEAEAFCDQHSGTIAYAYKEVYVGKMNLKKGKNRAKH